MTENEIHERNAAEWRRDKAWSDTLGEPRVFHEGSGFFPFRDGVLVAPALNGVYLRRLAKVYGPEFIKALSDTMTPSPSPSVDQESQPQ